MGTNVQVRRSRRRRRISSSGGKFICWLSVTLWSNNEIWTFRV